MKTISKTVALLSGSFIFVAGIAFAADDDATVSSNARARPDDASRAAQIQQDHAAYERWHTQQPADGWDRQDRLTDREECWNPHARHWEDVRPGEYQNDLDFSRCRMVLG